MLRIYPSVAPTGGGDHPRAALRVLSGMSEGTVSKPRGPDKNSLHQVCADLLLDWVRNRAVPFQPMEGVTPSFVTSLSSTPAEFTFDSFFQPSAMEGWSWKRLAFHDYFDGLFYLYLPSRWGVVQEGAVAAAQDETGGTRQTIFLTPLADWAETLPRFLERREVVGFAFYPVYLPYLQWVIVTEGEGAHWMWGVYSAGDWILLIKADARDEAALREQLTSLVNSNPWHDWIETARRLAPA